MQAPLKDSHPQNFEKAQPLQNIPLQNSPAPPPPPSPLNFWGFIPWWPIYFTSSEVWISLKNPNIDFYLLFSDAFIKKNTETAKSAAFGTKMKNFSHSEPNMNFLKNPKQTVLPIFSVLPGIRCWTDLEKSWKLFI